MRTLALPFLLALSTPAFALDEPMLHLDAELGYACYADDVRHHGLFMGAEMSYALNGFWSIRGAYGYGKHTGFDVQQASVGLRYQLDVFAYVPWVDLAPGVYLSSGEKAPGETWAGFGLGFGFDRLIDESWSVGVSTRYHHLFGEERFPAYFTVGVRFGYRWVFGDPFAP